MWTHQKVKEMWENWDDHDIDTDMMMDWIPDLIKQYDRLVEEYHRLQKHTAVVLDRHAPNWDLEND